MKRPGAVLAAAPTQQHALTSHALEPRHNLSCACAPSDDLCVARRQVVANLQHADWLGLKRSDMRVDSLEVKRAIAGPQVFVLAAAGVSAVIVVHMQLEQAVRNGGERFECEINAGLRGRAAAGG